MHYVPMDYMPPMEEVRPLFGQDSSGELLDSWYRQANSDDDVIVVEFSKGIDAISTRGFQITGARVQSRFIEDEHSEHNGENAADALYELRRLSQMTIQQIATLLNVSRRSAHNWSNGGNIKPVHYEKLCKILGCIRAIDTGDTQLNQQLIFSTTPDGKVAFDLLKEGDFETFRALVPSSSRAPMEMPFVDRSKVPSFTGHPENWKDLLRDMSSTEIDARPITTKREVVKRITLPK